MKMNRMFLGIILLGLVYTVSATVLINVSANEGSAEACDNPTEFIYVASDPTFNEFNITTFTVSKSACVSLTFDNKAVIEHDITMDSDESIGFEAPTVHMKNKGVGETTFIAPNVDTEIEFYCSIPGHRETMNGIMIVGEGKQAPGFELPLVLAGLFAVIAIPKLRKD